MSLWAIWIQSSVANSLLDDGQHVVFAEHEQILALHLDLGAAVLGVEDFVALRYVERDALLAILVPLAIADGEDLAALRLLLRRVGENEPACGRLLLIDRRHDQPIAERLELHRKEPPLKAFLALSVWECQTTDGTLASRVPAHQD